MNANAYAEEIERRYPDRGLLEQIRAQLNADPDLDQSARTRLSDRVGIYLLDQDRAGVPQTESLDTT